MTRSQYARNYSKKPGTISFSLAKYIEGIRNPDGESILSHFTNISEYMEVAKSIEPEIDFSSKITRAAYKTMLLKLNEWMKHPTSRYNLDSAATYFGAIYLKGDGQGVISSYNY